MCGQVGIVFGRKRRGSAEQDYLCEVFLRLLLHSEARGPHASGLAWLKTDGTHRIVKQPLPASELVYAEDFQNALCEVDNQTTLLMGHARWRTRGDESDNRNNHPIRAGSIIGTHNGTLYNADYLFRRLRLPRYAEVDSELIFRLADRHAPDGLVDSVGLGKALVLCRGQMSAVLASRRDPGTVTVLKGNKPLHLWYHRQYRVVIYASDALYLEDTLGDERGWRELEVAPMTMLTLHHADLRAVVAHPLSFVAQDRHGTLPAGVAA
jgi:amidophosphoribosyltransferase